MRATFASAWHTNAMSDDVCRALFELVSRKRVRYLRYNTYRKLMAPVSKAARARREAVFTRSMSLTPNMKVLDLGGQPQTWEAIETPMRITILNLPGIASTDFVSHNHEIEYVEGDACNVTQFEPGDFDLVYSNSVIEHVGAEDRQQAFADEVRRLSSRYWVQTPCKWFPVEAHCGMPFWWFYPAPVRQAFIERWREKLPEWTEMVEGTRVLSRAHLERLFPDASLYTEWIFGFPKSYTLYSTG